MKDSYEELREEYQTKWYESGALAAIALLLLTRPATAKTGCEYDCLNDTGPHQRVEAVHESSHSTASHIGSIATAVRSGTKAYALEAYTVGVAFTKGSVAIAKAPGSAAFAAHPDAVVQANAVGSVVGGVEGSTVFASDGPFRNIKYTVGAKGLKPNTLYRVLEAGCLERFE